MNISLQKLALILPRTRRVKFGKTGASRGSEGPPPREGSQRARPQVDEHYASRVLPSSGRAAKASKVAAKEVEPEVVEEVWTSN